MSNSNGNRNHRSRTFRRSSQRPHDWSSDEEMSTTTTEDDDDDNTVKPLLGLEQKVDSTKPKTEVPMPPKNSALLRLAAADDSEGSSSGSRSGSGDESDGSASSDDTEDYNRRHRSNHNRRGKNNVSRRRASDDDMGDFDDMSSLGSRFPPRRPPPQQQKPAIKSSENPLSSLPVENNKHVPELLPVVGAKRGRCGGCCGAFFFIALIIIVIIVIGGAIAYFASIGGFMFISNTNAITSSLDSPVLGVNMMYFSRYTFYPISSVTSRRLYHDTIAEIASSQGCYADRVEKKAENRMCLQLLHPPDDDYLQSSEEYIKARGEAAFRSAAYSRRRELAFAYYVCCFSSFDEFTYLVSEVIAPYDEVMAYTLVTRVGLVAGVITEEDLAQRNVTIATVNASASVTVPGEKIK